MTRELNGHYPKSSGRNFNQPISIGTENLRNGPQSKRCLAIVDISQQFLWYWKTVRISHPHESDQQRTLLHFELF